MTRRKDVCIFINKYTGCVWKKTTLLKKCFFPDITTTLSSALRGVRKNGC